MTLQVIGAGLGRTGTASLKIALEQLLGGSCYHMLEVRERPAHPAVWAAAYRGRPPVWTDFFSEYRAAVDWPAASFWDELSEAFPAALVLLSVRDADAWWRSASNTIFLALATSTGRAARSDGWDEMAREMMAAFTPDWQDETAAKAAYLAHNDHVRASAPKGRFLEWGPGDGWGPICAALGLAEPEDPFPHVNTTDDFRAMLGLD